MSFPSAIDAAAAALADAVRADLTHDESSSETFPVPDELREERDRQRLLAAMAPIARALDARAHALGVEPSDSTDTAAPTTETDAAERSGFLEDGPVTALDGLAEGFGLSPFERDVLVLAAGVELDSDFARRCALAQGLAQPARPTFSLALACLDQPHWSALAPTAPLRHWRLLEVEGDLLTTAPLRLDERVLHYLVGVRYLDPRLAGLVEPVAESVQDVDLLTHGQRAVAEQVIELWSQTPPGSAPVVVQLAGRSRRAVAAATCAELGLSLHVLQAQALPTAAAEIDALARLWEREALLTGSALLVDCDGVSTADRWAAVAQLTDRVLGLVVVASDASRREGRRPKLRLDVPLPSSQEQLDIWRQTLDHAVHEEALLGESTHEEADAANPTDPRPGVASVGSTHDELEALASQFRLAPAAIREAHLRAATEGGPTLARRLWSASRRVARPQLEGLARLIEPVASWDDLVLPKLQRGILRQVVIHLRRQFEVYERWGFAAKSSRGLGLAALFAGGSGTGKTLAAEVLANDLGLDLYHIDLSSVISKYIGETEKNLKQVFDAAEQGGSLLLFDEADALFGKRSEIKDSHDRYANIEVSYLLQRMESFRGLSILTTNRKDALDTAFQRRLRFVVQFPFPDASLRSEIWRRAFPPQTPTEGLVPEVLARLDVTGGNIRNIALGAAFLASEAGEPVRMHHLLDAARSELAKLGKSLSDHETRGWI